MCNTHIFNRKCKKNHFISGAWHTSPLTCVPVYKWKHACECLSFICGSVCLWEVKPPLFHFLSLSLSAPPEWSVMNDPAFSRKPRCAKVDRAQHCSCDAGFHMSGTSDNSICQGGSIIQPHIRILAEISGCIKAITAGGCPLLVNAKCIIKGLVHPKMKISLCFTHPRGILGVYDFLLSDKSYQSYIKNVPGYSKRYHCSQQVSVQLSTSCQIKCAHP